MSQTEFKLPITYLDSSREVDPNLIVDLELITRSPTECPEPGLYSHVFDANSTVFGADTTPLWAQYYTADKSFLNLLRS